MATVTGLTAERMLEIEAASVVDGDVVAGELILTKHDGSQVNAGSVIGPVGPEGPIGSDLEVLTEQSVLDIGMLGQIRSGRELEVMDFEMLGLSAPLGLWNLSDFDDVSGNNRHLLEKGSVLETWGVNGLASTAVQFVGSVTNLLYIPDTGVADPFRIKAGSIAAWVKTAKQGALQSIVTKRSPASGQYGYWLRFNTSNGVSFGFSITGSSVVADVKELHSLSRICDDRWHFVVGTFDGSLQELYIDGVLEASQLITTGLIHPSTAPLNIGAAGGDASVAGVEPHFGRVDEAFITSEVLTEDRIRNLICAKIPHALGAIPSRVSISVYPSCKGASLVAGDFPVAYPPVRLYNFSGGSLANAGSDGSAALTQTGGPVPVAGVDGTKDNAYNFSGTAQRLTGPLTGLPVGTETVTYGCWFKTANGTATMYLVTWGTTVGVNDTRLYIQAGILYFASGASPIAGPFVADGDWHFATVVQENAATDGMKRKLYLDGRLVASTDVLNSIALSPGNFCIATSLATGNNFSGELDTVFIVKAGLNFDEITKLYTKTLHDHVPSPKNAGDHIEAMDEDHLLVAFDTLDISNRVSVKVAA